MSVNTSKAFLPAIASMSLGRAWVHDIETKLQAASQQGFKGIEIFYEDLEYVSKALLESDDPAGASLPHNLIKGAQHVRQLCDRFDLTIIGLQPFLFYEGLLDRAEHDRLITKLHVWFDIADTLRTDTIQIPSNFLPADQLTGDIDLIVEDLTKVADLGLQRSPQIRFAYENLCWGTHVSTWEQAWEIVERVNRSNFGMCLDTFNIAGGVWADPESSTGRVPDADDLLAHSLHRMAQSIDLAKIFYIQVVDAERLESPLVQGHPYYVEEQPSRMSWSRNARCFMYEEDRGAYLPAEQVARTIIEELGYTGYVSMELFSRTMSDPSEGVPQSHAIRAARAWKKFEAALALKSGWTPE
ncbi:hypothetical protein KVT40_001101 [Elsinoe batatas]|uniref:Xylose isomerase-like TIM barrel domain-containing protein n=1 Tax=Elsinoe batatas TaxID=2601811 RepID=A0A8K0L8K2_9PEZI|nr:hypothetical protein KVT40_001101 [Elsinoe batatas]